MDEANQVEKPVCGVTLWVTPEGESIPIPAEFAGVKMRKDGWPDKRDAKYSDFMAWADGLRASSPGIEGAEVVSTVEAFIAPLGEVTRTLEPVPFAQAFAKRVWDAQCPTEPRAWRLERVAEAMRNRGLSMDGVIM